MKTMELHYAKTMRYEGEEREYLTWFWNNDPLSGNYGWVKKPIPNFSCGEVAGKQVINSQAPDSAEQAEEWFNISNREDMIFLEKELVACTYWRDEIKHEIITAQNILRDDKRF